MKFIAYYLSLPFIYLIAFLPDVLLYGCSSFFSFIIKNITGYRKEVLNNNLTNAFPDYTSKQIKKLRNQFYDHFMDIVFESIKHITMSEKEVMRRVTVKNPELLDKFYAEGKNMILMVAHYNNWEWFGSTLSIQNGYKGAYVYKVLSNRYFGGFLKGIRAKYGVEGVPMDKVNHYLKSREAPSILMFASDQWPANPIKQHWTTFLNQETAVFIGAERFAQIYDLPVLFCDLTKSKRGYYQAEYIVITETPKLEEKGVITEKYSQLLNDMIMRDPAHWIWSHRRWKQKKADLNE